MRGQKTVMFQAFYAFRVFTKERVWQDVSSWSFGTVKGEGGQKMTRALSGVFWNLNRGWESTKFVVDKPISFVHMCYESKKDHIKKTNYLSLAWPSLSLNGFSAV